jgi:large subunit ribosomal protein L15
MKIHKKKKSVRLRGTNSGGHGSRKKWKGKGHHGGKGMAGTGKRADQKTTLVTKKYGHKYFGKQGITSKGTKRRKLKVINLSQIQKNKDSLMKKFGKENEIVFKNYKILGSGDLKEKLTIKAKEFTPSAKEKIEKAGGKAIALEVKTKKENKEMVESKEPLQEKETKKGSEDLSKE